MPETDILDGIDKDSSQPMFSIGAEDSNSDQTNRIGQLWAQKSEKAPLKGHVYLLGQKIPIVLFPNPKHPDVQED